MIQYGSLAIGEPQVVLGIITFEATATNGDSNII